MAKRAKMWHLVAGMAVLAVVVAGCGGSKETPAAGGSAVAFGDVAKGKQVFTDTCAACHGADAKGMTGNGKNLVQKSDWMKKQNDQALYDMIKKGRSVSDPENTTKVDMPPKGGNPSLSDDDIKDAVAYIRSLQK